MSFYDDASIVLIPSGYKESKLYCQKPTDGSGDLTFTRTGSTATRVNESGLIERCRTNLSLHSEDFTNAAWVKDGATVSGNTVVAPNGTQTMDSITFGTSGNNIYQQFTVSSGVPYTFSVWLSVPSGTQTVEIGNINVNVYTTVTVTTTPTRFTVTQTSSGTTRFPTIRATGTYTIYAWGAQFEIGDIATDYIPTTSAAVTVGPIANLPRLDYTGGGCPKLLMEPTRTNLVTYSQQLDNSVWTKVSAGSATNPVVTANYGISPDGYQNADRVQFSRTGNTASDYSLLDRSTSSTGGASVVSFYAKSLSGTKNLLMYYGGVGQVFQVTTEWQRFSLYSPTSNTDLTIGTRGGSGLYFTGGDQSIDILLWGVQKEAGSYATSYIPTFNASVTRNADLASKTSISSLIGQTEGTIFLEVDYSTNVGLDMFLSIRPSASNKIEILRDGGNIYVEVSSSTNFFFLSPKNVGTHKIAFAYKSGSTAFYIDGVLVNSNTTTYSFSEVLSDLFINQRSGGTLIEASNIKQVLLFKTRLSNSDLATLTTL